MSNTITATKYAVAGTFALSAVVVFMGFPDNAMADDFYFNPAQLENTAVQKNKIDLSSFEEGGQAEGKYHVDIYLNDDFIETADVEFKSVLTTVGKKQLIPCFSRDKLESYGLKVQAIPELKTSADNQCASIQDIPHATSVFDFNNQKVTLTVPQMLVNHQARGSVSPELWDEGITAFLLNYNFTGGNTIAHSQNAQDNDSYYLNLRPGINIGAWRIRNYSTWDYEKTQGGDHQNNWDAVYTYAQRDIKALKGQLTLGDSNTPSDVFDSVPFRGVQLASDDDMLPDSMKGYAPVIRGIAKTNAQVIVRQNDYIVYQTWVSPGPFEINDMYPTGGSGDYNVTIKEADGSEQQLVVPYASLPVLQREGRFKYSFTAGHYRAWDSSVDDTSFTQATAIYGLPWGISLYGGGQVAENRYQSLVVGYGQNLGDFGAVSVDFTQARSRPYGEDTVSGRSWRVRYSKEVQATGTNFSVGGYRYSSAGFYTLEDVLDSYDIDDDSRRGNDRPHNRTEMTLSQDLGNHLGSLSVNWLRENDWNSSDNTETIGVSYNTSWNGISYSLNYSYSHNNNADDDDSSDHNNDHLFSLNVSIPLDKWLAGSRATWTMSNSKQGTTNAVGLNGNAFNNRLNWSVQQGYTTQGSGNSSNLSASYQGRDGQLSAGYSSDRDQRRINYGLQGGVIIHRHGITLSQTQGETLALVEAPGVDDAEVLNQTGVSTDSRGYAVVPYLTAFRKNTISLNTEKLPENADIALSSQTVIPTRGAVVCSRFETHIGYRALFTLRGRKENRIPFGAMATADKQDGIVGDGGQLYMTGLEQHGTLHVQWGKQAASQCQVDYDLSGITPQGGIYILNGICH